MAPVLEEVLEGGHVLLDQEVGELGGAARVQQVGQELERDAWKLLLGFEPLIVDANKPLGALVLGGATGSG